MLLSILFQDLGEKAGSVESGVEGILTPDNMNEYSKEEEEDDSFEVRYKYNMYIYAFIIIIYIPCIPISHNDAMLLFCNFYTFRLMNYALFISREVMRTLT